MGEIYLSLHQPFLIEQALRWNLLARVFPRHASDVRLNVNLKWNKAVVKGNAF